MPVEVIIALVAVVAMRIIAGMKIPVLSPLLRGIWNICFKLTSFIPFFGWAAHFIIADTAKEKKEKEELIEVGDTVDGMVNAPWSGSYSAGSGSGSIQSGDILRDSDGNSYRARRDGRFIYLTSSNGKEVILDTDDANFDALSSFTIDGVHFTR